MTWLGKLGFVLFCAGLMGTMNSLVNGLYGTWVLPALFAFLLLGLLGCVMMVRDPSVKSTGLLKMKVYSSGVQQVGFLLTIGALIYVINTTLLGATPWAPYTGPSDTGPYILAVALLLVGLVLWFRPKPTT